MPEKRHVCLHCKKKRYESKMIHIHIKGDKSVKQDDFIHWFCKSSRSYRKSCWDIYSEKLMTFHHRILSDIKINRSQLSKI